MRLPVATRHCFGAPRPSRFVAKQSAEDVEMLSRRAVLSHLVATCGVLGTGMAAWGRTRRSGALQALDPDNDGTVDLNEAKKAAEATFDRLDRDHDGTLDKRELAGRLSARDLAAADPDKDGTLTKAEYLAVVEQRFRAADPDHDGTIDAKELRSSQGRALLRLL